MYHGGAESSKLPVPCGVPQSFVLGPFLFLVVINNLKYKADTILFADYTTFMARGPNSEQARLNVHVWLEGSCLWFRTNTQRLNPRTSSTHSKIDELKDPLKLLGLLLDFGWDSHIDQICARLSRVIFLMRRLNDSVRESHLVICVLIIFF